MPVDRFVKKRRSRLALAPSLVLLISMALGLTPLPARADNSPPSPDATGNYDYENERQINYQNIDKDDYRNENDYNYRDENQLKYENENQENYQNEDSEDYHDMNQIDYKTINQGDRNPI